MTSIAFFSAQPYERPFFDDALSLVPTELGPVEIKYISTSLNAETAALAAGCTVACIFVNDNADQAALKALHAQGVRLLALRCAGFNQVHLDTARALNIPVVRVPAYSPYAVAEHAIALMLTLNRRTHKAFNRVREGNFSLQGLLGFDMHGRTAGLIGLGKIGLVTAKLLLGFGCTVLAYDPYPNAEAEAMGVQLVPLEHIWQESDIISLHCPLMPETHHLINETTLSKLKQGVMIINTSRGALIDTQAAIEGLKKGIIGHLGLDVYEEEAHLFFRDLSGGVLQDDVFARLLTFPNVLITGHQGFFTEDALHNIATTTLGNVYHWLAGEVVNGV